MNKTKGQLAWDICDAVISFIVISNKEQRHCSIFVFYLLSFTCDGLNFIGKSELPYVHLEIPSLARNNHQVEMKAT